MSTLAEFDPENFTGFRCPLTSSPKPSVDACDDGPPIVAQCCLCQKDVWVCQNQQLAIQKKPSIRPVCFVCVSLRQ